MTQIMLWKLIADIALVFSLIYFAYRFFRSRGPLVNIAELQELNARLKAAVREADDAGRALSDQLLNRKQSLEKMLFDIETVEHRLNRSITNAEEQKGALEIAVKRAAAATARDNAFITASSSPEIEVKEPTREPNREIEKQQDLRSKLIRTEVVLDEPAPPTFGENVIVQVERTQPLNARKHNPYIALSESVEKEVDLSSQIGEQAALEEIYVIAEKLIQTGRSLEEVAARTSLPIDEVRMISQVLEREQLITEEVDGADKDEIASASSNDTRLGVLAGLKRQTQIL